MVNREKLVASGKWLVGFNSKLAINFYLLYFPLATCYLPLALFTTLDK